MNPFDGTENRYSRRGVLSAAGGIAGLSLIGTVSSGTAQAQEAGGRTAS